MFYCYVDTECGSDDQPDADDDARQSDEMPLVKCWSSAVEVYRRVFAKV